MGKHKMKKFSAMRPNPTGLTAATEAGFADGQHDELKEMILPCLTNDGRSQTVQEYVTTLLEKLQSPTSEDRACGCQMLTIVASHPKAIDVLVQKDVSRIIYPLFLDPSSDVKINVLGAVRNICVSSSEKVVNALIESDILTPLSALIKQFKDDSPEQCKKKLDVLLQAIKLLSVLCESNPRAVLTFNKENLLQHILPRMDPEKFGYPLACAVGQCLYVVSENNLEVSKVFQAADLQAALVQRACGDTVDMDAVLFRTLINGVLLNLTDIDISSHNKTIVQKLSEVLVINHVEVLKMAIVNESGPGEKSASEVGNSTSDLDKLVQAQGICLELLANLCCSDDEWDDMDCETEESSDDQGAGQVLSGSAISIEAMDGEEKLSLGADIASSFLENEIISKVLLKVAPIDLSMSEQLQGIPWGKGSLSSLRELQSRALLCLSNLVSAMDVESLSRAVTLPAIWTDVYKLAEIAIGSSDKDEDYMWSVTSALRAVIQRMTELNVPNIGDISTNDLDLLINLGANSQSHETQINILRTMSAIGCILATQSHPHPLLNKIGLCLIEVACNNGNLVVISEALDSIFDMFKEDHTDVVVREIGLVEKLKSVQSSFKTKISSERKMLGENFGVVMMAKDNLKAYIKYKTRR